LVGHVAAARDFLGEQLRRLLRQAGDDTKAAGIRHCGCEFGKADIMHAALDDRMLDTEQVSDCCLHVKTPFSDQWTISNRPAAPMPPPMHMVTTPYFALRRRPS